jgi:putative inorganic carbon (HCO3(-)) transporter
VTSLLLAGLALGSVVGIAAILARPDLAVFAAVLLLYSDAVGVAVKSQGAPVALAGIVPLLLVVPVAVAVLRGRPLVLPPASAWIGAFLLVACISAALSSHATVAVRELAGHVTDGLLVYVLVVNAIREPRQARLAAWALVAGAGFLAAVAVFQRVTGAVDRPFGGFAALDISFLTGKGDVARAGGPLADPNYFAQILLPAIAIALVFALRPGRGVARATAAAAAAVLIFGLACTYSRGAALALVAALALLAAMRILSAGQIAVAGMIVVVVVASDPSYRDRLSTITAIGGISAQSGSSGAADQSTRSRATETLAAALVLRDHPVVGVGPGVFPLMYQQYAPQIGYEVYTSSKDGKAPEREAHNLFLGIAADLGIGGLLAFCGLIAAVLGGLGRARRRWRTVDPDVADLAAALSVGIASYVIAGLFLSLAYERYFWLLLGLGAATAALRFPDAPQPTPIAPSASTSRGPAAAAPDPRPVHAVPA